MVADKVIEIALLNRVQILAPRFVFSEDFGFGTELLPDLRVGRDTSAISHWICAQFGYGNAVGVSGYRSVIARVLVQARNFGRPASASDLMLTKALATSVPANLTCSKI